MNNQRLMSGVNIAQTVAGLALVAVGGIAIYGGMQLPYGSLRAPGPGMMPVAVGFGLIVVGLLTSVLFSRSVSPVESNSGKEHVVLPVWLASALLLAFTILIPILGFYTASFIFTASAVVASRQMHPLLAVVVSALTIGVLYVIFKIMFDVILPSGLFI
jgi:hypothetical protein